jgi:hypothetical protein
MPAVRSLTTAFAAGRIGYAAGLLASPSALGRPWVGPDAGRAATGVALRGLGARDLAASAALLVAARRGAPLRPWLLVCIAGDVGDAAATALGGGIPASGQRKGVAVAGVTAALGAALALRS